MAETFQVYYGLSIPTQGSSAEAAKEVGLLLLMNVFSDRAHLCALESAYPPPLRSPYKADLDVLSECFYI